MNAVKYETEVRHGGKVEVTLSDMPEGTKVEVIVLYRESASEISSGLLVASESSLGFWNNAVDDEVWNEA